MLLNRTTSVIPEDISLLETATSENNRLMLTIANEAGIQSTDDLETLEDRDLEKINPDSRLHQFTARSATIIAREKNDPLFKRMTFHRRKYLKYREMIREKYANKCVQRAQIAMEAGKRRR